MTETLLRVGETRERAKYPRPHVGAIAVELGKLIGISAKHAERHLAWWRRVNDRIVEACRRANRMDWLAMAQAHCDAQRQIDATPLTADSAFACLINRSVLAEAGALTDFAADLSAQHRAHLLSRSVKLLGEVSELIVALRAAP